MAVKTVFGDKIGGRHMRVVSSVVRPGFIDIACTAVRFKLQPDLGYHRRAGQLECGHMNEHIKSLLQGTKYDGADPSHLDDVNTSDLLRKDESVIRDAYANAVRSVLLEEVLSLLHWAIAWIPDAAEHNAEDTDTAKEIERNVARVAAIEQSLQSMKR